ncbi:MAG: hypothetical protein KDH09_15170, partial [Chrysiogenetes bacterium]|nr:hypothetical protein [Chrysiogenetes bacterium]
MPKTIIEQRERFQVARQNPEFKAQNLGALAAVEDTASFLGETGLDEANTIIERKAKLENAKATRKTLELQADILSRRNEFRDDVIAEGLDPETDEGRVAIENKMAEAYIGGSSGISEEIGTFIGAKMFEQSSEHLTGNFQISAKEAAREVQRDAALTAMSADVDEFSASAVVNPRSPSASLNSL